MTVSPLTDADRDLVQQAVDASDRLYLRDVQEVAAAVRTTGGQTFTAIHFESAAAFATVCGEVAALSVMVSAGHRDLETVAAVWRAPEGHHVLLPPCGRCREVLSDFNPEAWVLLADADDHWAPNAITRPVKVRLSSLLPGRAQRLAAS